MIALLPIYRAVAITVGFHGACIGWIGQTMYTLTKDGQS